MDGGRQKRSALFPDLCEGFAELFVEADEMRGHVANPGDSAGKDCDADDTEAERGADETSQ